MNFLHKARDLRFLLLFYSFVTPLLSFEKSELNVEDLAKIQGVSYWKFLYEPLKRQKKVELQIILHFRSSKEDKWQSTLLASFSIDTKGNNGTIWNNEVLVALEGNRIIYHFQNHSDNMRLPKYCDLTVLYSSPGKSIEDLHVLASKPAGQIQAKEKEDFLQMLEVKVNRTALK